MNQQQSSSYINPNSSISKSGRKNHRKTHHDHKTLQTKEIMKSRTIQSVNFKNQIRVFGVLAIIFEVIMCVTFGIILDNMDSSYNTNDLLIPASMAILTVVGLGLMNSYILALDLSSMGFVLVFFSMSVQWALVSRIIWKAIGISSYFDPYDAFNSKYLSGPRFSSVELVNSLNDRQQTNILTSNSIVDAMAVGMSIVIAIKTVMGRVGPLQLFFLTIFGTFFAQLNNQILWNLFVVDVGYGMRTFLYGGVLGLTSSIILWKRDTTVNNDAYCTNYFSQTYSLLGSIIVWIFIPSLVIANIYHYNIAAPFISTTNIIIAPLVLNTFFSLVSCAIGAFSASILINERIAVHQIIFSIFTGAIVYPCSGDIVFNPALALGVGTCTGFIAVVLIHFLKRKMNKKGVIDTHGTTLTYLLPGLASALVSTIVQATNPYDVVYTDPTTFNQITNHVNRNPDRSNWGQGAFQLIGMIISAGIAFAIGLIVGIIYKCINKSLADHQFIDQSYYEQIQKQE